MECPPTVHLAPTPGGGILPMTPVEDWCMILLRHCTRRLVAFADSSFDGPFPFRALVLDQMCHICVPLHSVLVVLAAHSAPGWHPPTPAYPTLGRRAHPTRWALSPAPSASAGQNGALRPIPASEPTARGTDSPSTARDGSRLPPERRAGSDHAAGGASPDAS